MALIVLPNIFTVGQTIVASQHNSNFSTIYSDYNGNITDVNLSASANIADTKLAQITTASKVSGTALTSLSSITSGAGIVPIANVASGTASGFKFVRDDSTLQNISGLISVSTSSPSAASSFTISGLTSGTFYKLILNVTQNTSNGLYSLIFNSDSGSNYKHSGLIADATGTGVSGTGAGATDTKIQMMRTGNLLLAANPMFAEINFTTYPATANSVTVYGQG